MFKQSMRSFGKQVLRRTKVKLVVRNIMFLEIDGTDTHLKYQRVTLTKFTTFFFFLTLINCIVLIVLQSISFADNAKAFETISEFLTQANITKTRIVYLSDDILYECKNIPTQSNADCSTLVSNNGNSRRGFDELMFGGSTIVQVCPLTVFTDSP